MKNYIYKLFMFLFVSSVAIADENIENAFTDYTKRIDMPKTWLQQSIKYDDNIGEVELSISLDQQLYPALLPLINKYADEKNIKIHVKEGTCGTSAKALKEKSADIAGFCCPPSETDRLPTLKFHTLGLMPLHIIVNPKNPINNLSLKQVRQIFGGEIFRWSQIKDTNKQNIKFNRIINVIGRLHCLQRPGHWRLLLDNEDLFSPRMLDVGSITDMITEVANQSSAIGYEVSSMIDFYTSKLGRPVKTIAIDGIYPNDNNKISNGNYPFYRTYNITTWESKHNKNQYAQDLITYLIKHSKNLDTIKNFIHVSELRVAGWKFHENELIGELKR
jgi:ABC-type phosphate transport system substrate-binding protein